MSSSDDSDVERRPSKRPHLVDSDGDDGDSDYGEVQNDIDDNEENACGRILKVRMVNFMCHGNLQVSFGKKINFVSGKNGSGKSAILTAIIIGLGGKSLDTSRGNSLKDLIKEGKNKATVTITLSNVGMMSHEPEVYGRELNIQRSITATSSSFRLLGSNGTSQPLTVRDLKMIVMRFKIQIANPLCVLTQDTARGFLRSSTSKERYELFASGTLLKSIQHKYSSVDNTHKNRLTELIEEKNKNFSKMYNDVLEYDKKVQIWSQVDELMNQENDLKGELKWGFVSSVEKKFAKTEEALLENKRGLDQIKTNLSDLKNNLEDSKAFNKKCKEDLQKLKEDNSQKVSDTTEGQQKCVHLKKVIEKKRIELTEQAKMLNKHENHAAVIIKAQKSMEEQTREKQSQKENELQELSKRYKELAQVKSTTEVHVKQLQDTYLHSQENAEAMQNRIQSVISNIRAKENYVKHLNNKSTQYELYAQWMPELLKKIDLAHSQNKFVRKPIGPMGSFIKVKNKDWARALETFVGRSFLKGFSIHCNQDYQVFKKIIQSLNIPTNQTPNISVFPFSDQLYNYKPKQTRHSNYEAMIDMFEVENPVVMNSLIDSFKVDKILLIPTRQESYQLMQRREMVPENCQMVLTMDGDTIHPAPNYSFYSCMALLQAQLIGASSQDVSRSISGELKALNQEKIQLENNLKALNASVDENRKIFNDANLKLKKINIEMAKNVTQREKCDETTTVAQQIAEFNSELEFRNKQMEVLKANIERCKLEKENAVKELERLNESLKGRKEEYQKYIKTMKDLEGRLKESEEKMNSFNSNYNKDNFSLKLFEDKCEELQKRSDAIKAELEKATAEAVRFLPDRVQTTRDLSEIERDLGRVDVKMKALKKTVPSKPVCPPRYQARLEELRSAFLEHTIFKKHVQELNNSCTQIQGSLRNLRIRTDENVNNDFDSMMRSRNICGSIILDHDREKLDFDLKTQGTSSQAQVKTLSGGETSFSMVSFILAMWAIMKCPFLVMDEFDVFMDNINRKITMERLLEHARKHTDQQFIFLTPHSVAENADDDDITIFRLQDPRAV